MQGVTDTPDDLEADEAGKHEHYEMAHEAGGSHRTDKEQERRYDRKQDGLAPRLSTEKAATSFARFSSGVSSLTLALGFRAAIALIFGGGG